MANAEAPVKPVIGRRHIVAAMAGNALEFYDFTLYAFFAIQIGHSFFPAKTAFLSLILSLATFGVGFVSRPVGAYVVGRYGDRAGRKPAMLLSFGLMGACVVALALTPSYAAIGMAAPVIVILVRLIQGFALGGDVGPTTAYLLEAASPGRRGLFGGGQIGSQGVATLAAGVVGLVLSSTLSPASLDAWGWRAAMLLGAAILPFGLAIRMSLPETLPAPHERKGAATMSRTDMKLVICGLMAISGATIATYVMTYMTTYASQTLHMKINLAFAATVVLGLCTAGFSPIGGALSDLFGRRALMIWPRLLLVVAIIPAFAWLDLSRDVPSLLGATVLIAVLSSVSATPILVCLAEALPSRVRSGAVGTIYAVAIAVFGGTTQPVITWLIHVTGQAMAPAWYLTAATVIGLAAVALLPETAPRLARA